MNKAHQNGFNNDYSYSEEIIDQYVMELPVFNDKKCNSATNQQRKKKVLKPIRTHTLSATRRRQCTSNSPYQTTYINRTESHSNTSKINSLLNNDHILRIKKLENELVEARMKTSNLIAENRLLKTLEKRHENALSMYEGKHAKLPQIMKSYEEDIRILQSRIHQMKISYTEMENRYKSQSTELLVLQKQHKHLLDLSKNKQLSKREKLSVQLEEAQNTIKQQHNEIQNFMKQLELQNKTHRHHLNSENMKVKQLQLEVKRLKENQNVGLPFDKYKTKNYSARQIFQRGITETSINITPRVAKSIPTIHGRGDETDESVYKTNESISLKPESLDKEEYEDHIKNVQMKSHTIKKINTLVNDMSYSSNMSSNISWLNRGLSKLTKENKTELSNITNNTFENLNEQTANTSGSILKTPMSRTQKDLLLANLNQVNEEKNSNEPYYKPKLSLLRLGSDNKFSSLDSNDTSNESTSSD